MTAAAGVQSKVVDGGASLPFKGYGMHTSSK